MKDNARLIKGDIWPLDDVSLADIEQDLETLAAHGRIVRYHVGGRRYLEIVGWHDHQSIQKPTPSKIPPVSEGTPLPVPDPPERGLGSVSDPDGRAPVALPEKPASYPHSAGSEPPVALPAASPTTTAGKGKEGKGREGSARTRASTRADPGNSEQRPPDRCVDHEDDPAPPPCGVCARAREAAQRWDADTAARAAARRAENQRARAADRDRAIAACRLCDERGYVGTRLCHHDPDATGRAARGMQRVRAALAERHDTTDPDTTTARRDHP
ncbi:hypothetical protein [Amycolatopsis arida]|uniref:hypothetical protein n=1 Tax=Amycolatopsis arida TaxID=587909 RepID=UPI00106633DC|nr:hypothetical protein [Amycolatopsis arida]